MNRRQFVTTVGSALVGSTLAAWAQETPATSPAPDADVCVYGATPGGIAAAIAAAREGCRVTLVEPSRHVGGMVAGGLSRTDVGKPEVIGGIALEFFDHASGLYKDSLTPGPLARFYSEPHIAEQAFNEMLREAKVTLVTGERLDLNGGVQKQGEKILSLRMESGRQFAARVFIDASYEGDLLPGAKVKYIVGREGRQQYGESLAGFRPSPLRPRKVEEMTQDDPCLHAQVGFKPTGILHYVHGTPAKISALGPDGKPLPGINPGKWPRPGLPDNRTQSYNFRVTVTRRPENRVPFPRPANYDPARYELLRRVIAAFPGIRWSKLVHLGPVPNGKYDANAIGMVVGTDHPGANTDYPDGNYATRDRIRQDHVDWVQGYFFFLANDPALPEDLRRQAAEWGLARDEFADNANWPYQLYIREARRMVGAYVMRQQDCTTSLKKPDAVGMGSFIMDSHCVQRLIDPDGNVIDEGNFDMPVRPYQIPYRCLTPDREQCSNLLVPVCLSASHVAYGTLRMEPQYMILGHACGVAAALAIRQQGTVQEVDIPTLQQRLLQQKAILEMKAAAPPKADGNPR